jgi:hypothetical protein
LEAVFANMNNSGAGPPDGQTYLVHFAEWSYYQPGKMCFCCSNLGNFGHMISAVG